MSTTMKAAQVSKPNGDWELVERDIPEPDAGQVRVSRSMRHVPQRRVCQRRSLAGAAVSACARS